MKNGEYFIVRWLIGSLCAMGLVFFFLFQKWDFAGALGLSAQGIDRFLINRTFRFLTNDAMAIGLIFALFFERKYLIFALAVQFIGLLFFLIPYFVLKVHYPAYNGPLISFLHRLVLNPTHLLLLIPAFYVQRISTSK